MATLMEKDALLNGASQCIAFLSNIIDNCSVSSHQDSGDALKRLVSYRDYLYSTWICPYISRHLLSLNPLLACCRRYSR
ncbi:hypothetical protein LXO67_08780, partial [Escherichia coli]|nr:hypothetical protein [Escherichia coli]